MTLSLVEYSNAPGNTSIMSMKILYFSDLNELHQRISLKLQQNDALPSAKAAEQFVKMNGFKMMLEHTLQVLQLSKANISPSLKDKIPLYEKQIQNILALNKKKVIPSQPPGQQQFQHPSSHSLLVQQQQQTQLSQFQQHNNYGNQQNNIQDSSNSMQIPAVQNMEHGSVSLSAHFGVTSQQNISTINQNFVDAATLDSIAPTGHVAVADLPEVIFQQIRSMKNLYFADLNELHQRISLKLQQNDALPSAKGAEQFEKMKGFKMMLERTLQVLQLSKANISPSLKDKIPMYEKQIQNILALNKKKVVP